MRILVTGGLGFIGSNFIRYILTKHKDYEITNLDKITYAGNQENLTDIENDSRYKFIKGDICDIKLVTSIIKDADIVVNFAAESHVDNSIINPVPFIRTNVMGTGILLECAKKSNIKRFLHISTDEVYGSIESGSFKESDKLEPSSPYSASKAAADELVKSYFITYKMPLLIARSSNNFGPYQYPEKLIPLFITNLLENKRVPLYGDGLYMRDWIYVIDNCIAIEFILNKGTFGEIYNIAAGNEVTNIELTKLILRYLGKDETFIEYVKDRPGHDRRYSLDCSKMRKLGWKPKSNFEEALKETINWYKNNENWWKKLKKS